MEQADMNASAMMIQTIVDPTRAFREALQRPRAWWPLVAVVAGTAAIYVLYFTTVDFDWFVHRLLNANPDLSDEQRAAALEVLKPMTVTTSTVFVALVAPTLVFALIALYYSLVGQLLGHAITYRKWFAFCVWTAVPRLIVFPLMLFQIASSHGQVALEDLSMVSLNFLLLHQPSNHPWAAWSSALDLTVVWSFVVGVIGFRVWTGESLRTSLVVNAIPTLAFFGLWALRIGLSG
jgi:uncharacterized membrane protein YqhA